MHQNKPVIDKRTMDRKLVKGVLKESDIQQHFKNLPDDESNAQWVQMDLHETDLSDAVESDLTQEDDLNEEDLDSAEVLDSEKDSQ